MHAAFAAGADVYIAANPNGAFHPDCIRALLVMNRRQDSHALIEALQFPEEHPKFYHPVTLRTRWVSDVCLLIPRLLWEKTGGFDSNFYLYCEDVDLSWVAHRFGFQTLTCPAALFHHDISTREDEAWRRRELLVSGRYLAHKWGDPQFMDWTERRLFEEGFVAELGELPPLDDLPTIGDGAKFADFRNGLFFSPVRW
jgi:GT2 family glycosyltransferase